MLMIFLYAMFAVIAYIVARFEYNPIKDEDTVSFLRGGQLSIVSILILSLFAVGINVYYTDLTSMHMAGDRANYLNGFKNELKAATVGLTFVFKQVKEHGGNFEDVLYLTTFISIAGSLFCYKISKISTPLGLLFCFLTPCLLNSFIALKQTYANAFASIAIILMMREKTWKKEALILFFIWLACQFHPVAYLMVPVYFLLRFYIKEDREYDISFILLIAIIVLASLSFLMVFIAKILTPIIPYLSSKILEYFSGEKDQIGDAGLILMLKGAYSYYITYYLIRYRTYIQYNLGFYNQILIISLIISACYLISPFNYWLPRTAFLLEFPVLLYWAKSLQYVPNWYWLRNVSLFLTGFFTFRTLLLIFVF